MAATAANVTVIVLRVIELFLPKKGCNSVARRALARRHNGSAVRKICKEQYLRKAQRRKRGSSLATPGSLHLYPLAAPRDDIRATRHSNPISSVSYLLRRELVDLDGFEPSTSSMPWKRAPNCATGPTLH